LDPRAEQGSSIKITSGPTARHGNAQPLLQFASQAKSISLQPVLEFFPEIDGLEAAEKPFFIKLRSLCPWTQRP
jgi:hypothetical protein